MPPVIGTHRIGVQHFSQGNLLQTTTRQFRQRWGLGVCRVLVAQWLKTGGGLEETPFRRAQVLQQRLLDKGRPDAAAGVGRSLEDMLGSMMDSDRDTTLRANGLDIVASMPMTTRRGDLVSFLTQGGLFYVKLADRDEDFGHAIGVALLIDRGVVRLFDPNTRVVAADVRTLFRHLFSILDYWEHTPPYLVQFEVDKVVGELPALPAAAAAAASATAATH
jgi:hypothetical protein